MRDTKLEPGSHEADDASDPAYDRRAFLAACGRFAIITPPAVTVLLSTTMTSRAIARSGGGDVKPPGGRLPPLPTPPLPIPKL